ncbi:MAG TPA: glycosyltransferase family 2 protein [Rhizomicrobium sp.]|jgi:cellulose synthase/poly-beta-1,6-N-acetylglucosamine synthase-like glycosyltransferase|nr:glycosyltransferase family 2 protein [Rhizomicrobium sp.]
MHGLSIFLQFALCLVLVSVCTLSVQLAALAWVRVFRKAPLLRRAEPEDGELPHVLVQLPVCNEGPLAVRVAAAAAAMDWPRDRLTIQLLDDGDSHAHESLAAAVRAVVPEGVHFQILRRGDRKGFKAGNLAFGLAHSDAPFVAVLDADFVPPADFLRRTVPALIADSGLAFVQARWGHANRGANWLTRVQGLLLDSHFAVEQEARYRAGMPMSFNGSAGVWNRTAIEQGGGWTGDTLTEDLDLSMRCMMQGWRAAMVSDLVVPGELPQTAAAWRAQQARWTKGHAQVARKLLPLIWASAMPLWKKAAMTLQMCQFAFYMLAFASATISLTLMYMGVVYYPGVAWLGLMVTLMGLCCSIGYLWLGQCMLNRHGEAWLFPSLLLAVVFPSGLILSNTRATFDAFFSSRMDFNRTTRVGEVYKGGWRGGPELVVGVLLPAFALAEQPIGAPFFFFAVAGLVSIGVMGAAGAPKPVQRRITQGE